jgi:hypothetical protein
VGKDWCAMFVQGGLYWVLRCLFTGAGLVSSEGRCGDVRLYVECFCEVTRGSFGCLVVVVTGVV